MPLNILLLVTYCQTHLNRKIIAPHELCGAEEPSPKSPRDPRNKGLITTCEQSRRVVVAPTAAKPIVVPTPCAIAEIQTANIEAAKREAVNGAPEEDEMSIPV